MALATVDPHWAISILVEDEAGTQPSKCGFVGPFDSNPLKHKIQSGDIMFRFSLTLFICLVATGLCCGQYKPPAKFRSEAATEAYKAFRETSKTITKSRDSAQKAIQDDFELAFKKLRDGFVTRLESLQEAETKGSNLDAAVEIREAIQYFKKLKSDSRVNYETRSQLLIVNRQLKQDLGRLESEMAQMKSPRFAEFKFAGEAEPELVELAEHQIIFSNRDYLWRNIPEELRGFSFTKHKIRQSKTYKVAVDKPGIIVIGFGKKYGPTNYRAAELFEGGWICLPDWEAGNVEGESTWKFAKRYFSKGEHNIPLGHPHSGTVVFVPGPQVEQSSLQRSEN